MNDYSEAFDVIGQSIALMVFSAYLVWVSLFLGFARGEIPSPAKPIAEVEPSKRGRLKSGRMSGFRRRTEPPVTRRPSRPLGCKP